MDKGLTGSGTGTAAAETAAADTAAVDAAAVARHERYGRLPERIRFTDMTEELEAGRGGKEAVSYHPEGSWKYYSCLALDLGL